MSGGTPKLAFRRPGAKLRVFLVCLSISAFIWLTRALSKEYATELNIKVEYIGVPEDLGWVRPLPDTWVVKVSSYGFGLLGKKYFSTRDAIIVDVSRMSAEGRVEIETLDFANSIARQLGSDNQILEIIPEIIVSELSMNTSKTVPVHLTVVDELPTDFFISPGKVCSPDSVIVRGPKLLLDTLRWMATEPVTVNMSSEDDTIYAAVISKPGLDCATSEVALKFEIDQYTGGSVSVPIQRIELSDGLRLRTIPDHTQINYQVGFKDYESINARDFAVVPEIPENVSVESLYKLRLNITESPDVVRNLQMEPARVEFVLEKR